MGNELADKDFVLPPAVAEATHLEVATIQKYCRQIEAAGDGWQDTQAGKIFRWNGFGRPYKAGSYHRWRIPVVAASDES